MEGVIIYFAFAGLDRFQAQPRWEISDFSRGVVLSFFVPAAIEAEPMRILTLTLVLLFSVESAHAAVTFDLYATGDATDGGYSALFKIDITTGLATEVGPTTQGYFLSGADLAYDSKNNQLLGLGANGLNPSGLTTSELFVVDQVTGTATPIGWTGSNAILSSGGLTYDAANDVLYATGQDNTVGPTSVSTFYTVDASTGLATRIGPTDGVTNLAASGLAYDSIAGDLFGTGILRSVAGVAGSRSLFLVDPTSGGASLVGPTQGPFSLGSGGLAINPSNGLLYATGVKLNASGTWDSYLFTVDRASGAATVVGPTGAMLGFGGLAFVPDAAEISPVALSDLTNNGFVDFEDLTILLANWNTDVTAAEGNLVFPETTSVDFTDLTFLLSEWTGPGPAGSPDAAFGEVVPEPSTLLLALLATLGLSFYRRRRRRAF